MGSTLTLLQNQFLGDVLSSSHEPQKKVVHLYRSMGLHTLSKTLIQTCGEGAFTHLQAWNVGIVCFVRPPRQSPFVPAFQVTQRPSPHQPWLWVSDTSDKSALSCVELEEHIFVGFRSKYAAPLGQGCCGLAADQK